jgi:hypothetical protein
VIATELDGTGSLVDVAPMEAALEVVACLVNEYGAVVTEVDVKGPEDGSFTMRVPKLATQLS